MAITSYIKKNALALGLLLFFATLTLLPLFKTGFYTMYDDMQVARVWQMDKCIGDLQIPCRWVPDLGLGYGYPLFIFYAPLPYYVMEIFYLISFSFVTSVKLGFIFSVFTATLFFYLFTRFFLGKKASFIAALFYLMAPFRAGSIYVRGAMGEAWGMASVALLFWSFENFLQKRNLRSGLIYSLGLFAFVTTHNLSVLVFFLFFAVWVVLRVWQVKVGLASVKYLLLFSLLGFGMSSFFLIPIIAEMNLVHLETLTSGYFGYLQHFLNLRQIFISTHWGYGPSIPGSFDDAFLGIGPVHGFSAILGFIVLILTKGYNKAVSMGLFLVFLASSFLMHERSTFIWKVFKLEILQFPWRFAALSVFISSLFAGFAVHFLPRKLSTFFSLATATLLLTLYLPFFQPKDWFYMNDEIKLTGENLKKQLTASIYDYLPKSAEKAPDEIAPSGLIAISESSAGEYEIVRYHKGSNWIEYDVNLKSEPVKVAIPVYDYPGWEITVDNNKIPEYELYGELGLPSVLLEGEGIVALRIELKKTWDRFLGDLVTFLSIITAISFIAYEKYTNKKIFKF